MELITSRTCAWDILDRADPAPRPLGVDNTSCRVSNLDHDLPPHDCIAKQEKGSGCLEVVDYPASLFRVEPRHSARTTGGC